MTTDPEAQVSYWRMRAEEAEECIATPVKMPRWDADPVVIKNGWNTPEKCGNCGEPNPHLAAAERTVREQREALERCIDTAKELRRHIDPNHGCGYLVYKEVWDASRAAEIDALAALASAPPASPDEGTVFALEDIIDQHRRELSQQDVELRGAKQQICDLMDALERIAEHHGGWDLVESPQDIARSALAPDTEGDGT